MTLSDTLALYIYNFMHLMELSQPEATFFPYTTLFRSKNGKLVRNGWPPRGSSHQASMPAPKSTPGGTDRKSTRLNSSHGYISYAVFCLKKKTPGTVFLKLPFTPTPPSMCVFASFLPVA